MSEADDTALLRAGLWQWVTGTGLERFELRRGDGRWLLRGTILGRAGVEPVEARYRVTCDGAWRTRDVQVVVRGAGGERRLALAADDGRWIVNGREEPALQGAIDVDLEWSPSTNTLPIRRLLLSAGSGASLRAAWVRFPGLTVEPLAQAYARVAESRYRYTSGGGSFTADLEVDEDGLVVDYQGVWRRVRGA